eukprot:14196385-Ditylum_brightwellii.AAC.1
MVLDLVPILFGKISTRTGKEKWKNIKILLDSRAISSLVRKDFPQYHLGLDDEFTMIPYLQADEVPYNWQHIVENYSEHAIDEAFTIATASYEGEKGLTQDS